MFKKQFGLYGDMANSWLDSFCGNLENMKHFLEGYRLVASKIPIRSMIDATVFK